MSFDVLLAIDVVVVSSVAVVAVELCGVAVSTTAVCAIVL